jgi:hypothetical protein
MPIQIQTPTAVATPAIAKNPNALFHHIVFTFLIELRGNFSGAQ